MLIKIRYCIVRRRPGGCCLFGQAAASATEYSDRIDRSTAWSSDDDGGSYGGVDGDIFLVLWRINKLATLVDNNIILN